MHPRSWIGRLAGEQIRAGSHICALFDGSDDGYRILAPFVVDGLRNGAGGFHVVEDRAAHVDGLEAAGVAVRPALASGSLSVHAWLESYTHEGRFDLSFVLAFLRRHLDATGRRPSGISLLSYMDWTAEGVPGVEHVGAYEAHLEGLAQRTGDVVICVYDIRRHSGRAINAALGAHPLALIDGTLRPGSVERPASSARDRILTAASSLFGDSGIRLTGVDRLIDAAGVAKATFYRHFPSKDDLIVAWLQDPRSRWFDRVRARVEASGAPPEEAVPLFFEALAEWLEAEDFRGCPYLNTSVEISDPEHPARAVIRTYLEEIESYLRGLAERAGARDSAMVAAELHTLTAGAISLAVARRTAAFALSAREAAILILAEATSDQPEEGIAPSSRR